MRKSLVVVLAGLAMALAGCNAVKGAGRDIQSVGKAGEDVLND